MRISSFLPPREISLLAGASGAGKSTFALQYIDAALHNQAFLSLPTPPDSCWGYIKADRKVSDIESLAARIHFNLDHIFLTDLISDRTRDVRRLETYAIGLLEDILRELKGQGCSHVVVDPITVFIGENLNQYNKVAVKLIQLNRVCEDLGLTVLGTHHTVKPRSDFQFLRPQDSISGSAALQGYTSTQLNLATPEETQKESFSRLSVTSHTAAPETIYLKRDPNGLFEPADAMVKALAEKGEASFKVLSLFSNGTEVRTATILETLAAEGYSQATAFRRIKELEQAHAIVKVKPGRYVKAH